MIIKGVWIGLITGVILGLFLKLVEFITSIRVYTLLLNVDFVPVVGSINWPEWVEFLFHLIISLIIGIIFVYILLKTQPSFTNRFLFSLLLTFPTIFLFFPLTIIAITEVPAPTDMIAFAWWISGHLVYSISLTITSMYIIKY